MTSIIWALLYSIMVLRFIGHTVSENRFLALRRLRIRKAEHNSVIKRFLLGSFLPARRYASAGLCDSDVSVRLSVCLSHAGIVPSRAKGLFYENALIDHENAFRNITKTHFETLRKRMEKVYKNAPI